MPQTGKLASWLQAELEGSIEIVKKKKPGLVQPTHQSLFLYKVRNTAFYDTGLQVTTKFQDAESTLVSRHPPSHIRDLSGSSLCVCNPKDRHAMVETIP
jgi:hypothetical protein